MNSATQINNQILRRCGLLVCPLNRFKLRVSEENNPVSFSTDQNLKM